MAEYRDAVGHLRLPPCMPRGRDGCAAFPGVLCRVVRAFGRRGAQALGMVPVLGRLRDRRYDQGRGEHRSALYRASLSPDRTLGRPPFWQTWLLGMSAFSVAGSPLAPVHGGALWPGISERVCRVSCAGARKCPARRAHHAWLVLPLGASGLRIAVRSSVSVCPCRRCAQVRVARLGGLRARRSRLFHPGADAAPALHRAVLSGVRRVDGTLFGACKRGVVDQATLLAGLDGACRDGHLAVRRRRAAYRRRPQAAA